MSEDWASRAELPSHVVTMLNNFPSHLHPMAQFSAACAALNSESKFAKVLAYGYINKIKRKTIFPLLYIYEYFYLFFLTFSKLIYVYF